LYYEGCVRTATLSNHLLTRWLRTTGACGPNVSKLVALVATVVRVALLGVGVEAVVEAVLDFLELAVKEFFFLTSFAFGGGLDAAAIDALVAGREREASPLLAEVDGGVLVDVHVEGGLGDVAFERGCEGGVPGHSLVVVRVSRVHHEKLVLDDGVVCKETS
jgi:hypothetical protein